jgi:hypothetical protein
MELDTIMVSLNKPFKMGIKLRFLISGSLKEILGKLKDKMSHTISDSMEIFPNIKMELQRELHGRTVKESLLWPMIPRFQVSTLITLTI